MNFGKKAAKSDYWKRQYDKLKADHTILLGEATKAAAILRQQNTLLDKYRELVSVKDGLITALKKEIELRNEKEGCCCGNCKNESTVRDGENPGGELHNVADGRDEEVSHADESDEGGAGESEGSVRDGSSDEAGRDGI